VNIPTCGALSPLQNGYRSLPKLSESPKVGAKWQRDPKYKQVDKSFFRSMFLLGFFDDVLSTVDRASSPFSNAMDFYRMQILLEKLQVLEHFRCMISFSLIYTEVRIYQNLGFRAKCLRV
jgi:hypothetical protein